ncbi:MAG TPA: hypothetical protein VEA81_06355 [Burkholderiaceae bacterium]|nr:hypothetical protein [Burkholderiaceae bacterium]
MNRSALPSLRRACAAALLVVLPVASPAHEQHGRPMHGGVLAEAGTFQGELVNGPKGPVLYVTDHGAPVATAGASAKLTVLAGGARSDLQLVPAGANRLAPAQGEAPLARGARAVASVKLADGRSGALRFELK